MNRASATSRVIAFAALVGAVAAWADDARAQDRARPEQPVPAFPRLLVRTAAVRPDSETAFVSIVRDQMIPALKKAGVPWMQTWSPFLGESFTYVMVTPVSDFGQFDGRDPVELTLGSQYEVYRARLDKTLVSAHAAIETLRRDASIESGDAEVPNFATVQTFLVLPGRAAEFLSVIARDFLPVYKAGGQRDLWVYATNFGGPAGQFTVVRPFSDSREMAGRYSLNSAGLSTEDLAMLNARRNALISSERVDIVHPVRELSYSSTLR